MTILPSRKHDSLPPSPTPRSKEKSWDKRIAGPTEMSDEAKVLWADQGASRQPITTNPGKAPNGPAANTGGFGNPFADDGGGGGV